MEMLEERIRKFNSNRVAPMLALKYKAMAANEFSFFRATCHLFYEDIHLHPGLKNGPLSWICGDLHLENFGSYRAANGLVYFDINDFDEAVLAGCSWELVRFLSSIGMASDLWQYSMKEAKDLMSLTLQAYTRLLSGGKAYAIQEEASPPLIAEFFEMARQEKERKMVGARMDKKKETLKIIPGKTLPVDAQVRDVIIREVNIFLKEKYGFLEVRDAAFRIAGAGSLGVRRYVLLTYDSRKEKWRLLDIKASAASSLAPYVDVNQLRWENDADRILKIQGMMQYALPRFIGTLKIDGVHYVLKQLQPSSNKIDHSLCHKKMKNVETVMTTMAEVVASAQLRSASRKGSASIEELIAFAQESDWQDNLVKVALDYTTVMKDYYRQFSSLYKKGSMEHP